MKSTTQISLFLTLLAGSSHAFAPTFHTTKGMPLHASLSPQQRNNLITRKQQPTFFRLAATADKDDEVERLKSMAAKLRAEASALEAEKAQELAQAAEKAFSKFDTNNDGQVSLQELKDGLEKSFKMELSEKRVKQLMEDFDKSGDGTLQLDEFVTVDRFRNKLDALAREEKVMAKEAARLAAAEEEAAKFLEAQLSIINDGPPSATDKIISVLPYLFPLLDGLQFARFLVMENPDNPLSALVTLLYVFYRSIPFSGFIAFFALSFLQGNVGINRLIRFNMSQAIYLDVALFFPGLLAALYGLIAQGTGFTLPPQVTELGSDALFVSLVGILAYTSVSSLLGITPDKIPLISDAVNARMPTIAMFDPATGRLKDRNEDKDENDEKKD